MAGLAVAAANPRYQFMVYNASVHHWRVAAPLHRDGLRQHLLPSTEQMVQVGRLLCMTYTLFSTVRPRCPCIRVRKGPGHPLAALSASSAASLAP